MESLKRYFLQSGFNDKEVESILSFFHTKQFEKGDFFVREGRVAQQLGFIHEGVFQYYTLAKDEERTTYIAFRDSFIASLLSYLREIPSPENIVALTKASVSVIDKKNVLRLQKEIPGFKDFYIGLLEYQICCIDDSRFDMLTLSAEERYKKIMEKEPILLQQIPLHHIASMLGITQRHLSRIRNNI